MKTKKHVINGWIAKDGSIRYLLKWNTVGELSIGHYDSYKTRGFKHFWNPDSYPPKKIRITIEEV